MDIKLSDFTITPLWDTVRHEDISDEEYFAQYKGFITASKLHKISPRRRGSMKNYYYPEPFEWKESLATGSYIHECVLQPNDFRLISEPIGKPSAKLGEAIDAIYRYRQKGYSIEDAINKGCDSVDYYKNNFIIRCKKLFTIENLNYYKKLKNYTNKDVIPSDKNYLMIKSCIDNLTNHYIIKKQLHPTDIFGDPLPSFCEDTIYLDFKVTYQDKEIILHFKGKIDNWTIDTENKILCLNDVKTTSDPVDEHWIEPGGHFDAFAYDSQLAIYQTALIALAKRDYGFDNSWQFRSRIWGVCTKPPYQARCYRISDNWLTKGKETYEDSIKRVAYYELFGHETEVNFID